jgi:hypothetical protein
MLYREFFGAVVDSKLSSSITDSDSSITIDDGSTFPVGTYPFAVVIERGTPAEEKVLIASRTGNVLSVSQRGYDGTPASSHPIGSVIDHIVDATSIQDMNTTTYDNKLLLWVGL